MILDKAPLAAIKEIFSHKTIPMLLTSFPVFSVILNTKKKTTPCLAL